MNNYSQLSEDFLARGKQLVDFVATHNRLPRQSGAETDEERGLGDFLRVARMNTRPNRAQKTSPLRLAWLDEHVPTWRTENRRANTDPRHVTPFDVRVQQIAAFVSANGDLPKYSRNDNDERALAVFLINQRQAQKGKGTTAWSQERKEVLDTALPGWDGPFVPTFGLPRNGSQKLEGASTA